MAITPPQAQTQTEFSLTNGTPVEPAVIEPGAQGETMTGMQGIGVSTPSAAAVAAVTSGLRMLSHSPKEVMLASATIMSIHRTGMPFAMAPVG